LKDHGDKLHDDQREAIKTGLHDLKELLNSSTDVDKINEALQAFVPKAMPLFELAGKAEEDKQKADAEDIKSKKSNKDETVVDAQFTEVKDDK
jgi:hypothetical protein